MKARFVIIVLPDIVCSSVGYILSTQLCSARSSALKELHL